jgi:ATP-dependent RNA helicase DeaD
MEDDLERFRVVVETLTDEFDVMEVALAAVKLAHEAGGPTVDEQDIPQLAPSSGREGPVRRDSGRRDGGRERAAAGGVTRIFVGLGRRAGIRPQDLVGAIAGESRLRGSEVGAIEIADRFSLVEVPRSMADEVISALRTTTIKGKKATVRLERDPAR